MFGKSIGLPSLLGVGCMIACTSLPTASAASISSSVSGDELVQLLATEYKPKAYFSYNTARDFIYSSLDNEDNVITAIYTNYQVWVDQSSSSVRADAYASGINAEHIWPQSKGASGVAKGDVHHLFASKVDVNQARGNNPFGEISDTSTSRWYWWDYQQSGVPSAWIDEYSEYTSSMFEPREDRKGDVARAMFYFYTMYNGQSDFDWSFWNEQKSTMCNWHVLDPPSQLEYTRNAKIAASLQGNENPYISDSSFAVRAFCS
eukprot:CFRG6301T1